MQRYLFSYKGEAAVPAEDRRLIESTVNVVDSGRNKLLVEAAQPRHIDELAAQLPDWKVSQEQVYAVPSVRPQLKHEL